MMELLKKIGKFFAALAPVLAVIDTVYHKLLEAFKEE